MHKQSSYNAQEKENEDPNNILNDDDYDRNLNATNKFTTFDNDIDNQLNQSQEEIPNNTRTEEISLNHIRVCLYEKQKISDKIAGLKALGNRIQSVKNQIDEETLCEWIQTNFILETFLNDDSHGQLLRRLHPIIKLLYTNCQLKDQWFSDFAKLILNSNQQILTIFEKCCQFIDIGHLNMIFETIQKQENYEGTNFTEIIEIIISSPIFNEQQKKNKKKQRVSQQLPEVRGGGNLIEMNKNNQGDIFSNALQIENYPETEMDGDEVLEENMRSLASNIFELVVNHLSITNQKYINILNKLIAIKHQTLSKLVEEKIIQSLKSQDAKKSEPSYIYIFDAYVKIDLTSMQMREKGEKDPKKVAFIQKLAQNGLYQKTISMLAQHRYDKIITDKILSTLLQLAKFYRPLQKTCLEFLWKILGLNSRNQKEREQFFGFVKESLKHEAALSQEAVTYIYYNIMLSIDASWFSSKVYECFEILFLRLNEDLKLMIYDSDIHQYQIHDAVLIGLQKFWEIYYGVSDAKVADKCCQFLLQLTTYLGNCEVAVRNSFFGEYWKQLLKIIESIQENHDQKKFNKNFNMIEKLLTQEQNLVSKIQKERQAEMISIRVKNQTQKAIAPKIFNLTVHNNSTIQELKALISQKMTPKNNSISLSHNQQILLNLAQTLVQVNIRRGSQILVTDQLQSEDYEKEVANMRRQQIEENIEKLKQLCGGMHSQVFLEYIAKKYGDYDISRITDMLFDPDQLTILEQEFKIENIKSCESEIMTPFFRSLKQIENDPSLENLDSLFQNNKQMRFSNYITANRAIVNKLLECAQNYSVERGWEIIKLLPQCPTLHLQIETLLQNNEWEQIISKQGVLFKIYNLQHLRTYLQKLSRQSTKTEKILSMLTKIYDKTMKMLIEQISVNNGVNRILMKILTRIILHEIKRNIRFKDLQGYEKINRSFENCHLRKYLFDCFMDGSEKSHWNWNTEDSDLEEEQFKIIKQRNTENRQILKPPNEETLVILLDFITLPKQDSQQIILEQLLTQVLFYFIATIPQPFQPFFLMSEQQVARFYKYHGTFAEYITLYCLAEAQYLGTMYFEVNFAKVVQDLMAIGNKNEGLQYPEGNNMIAVFDTISVLINTEYASKLLSQVISDLSNSIRLRKKWTLQEFVSILQLLANSLITVLKSDLIEQSWQMYEKIEDFIEWLMEGFLFNIINTHELIHEKLARKYSFDLLLVFLDDKNVNLKLKEFVINLILKVKITQKKIASDEQNMNLQEGHFTGLKNLGSTCYMNSLLQQIYHTKFSQLIIQKQKSPLPEEEYSLPQKHIHQLKLIFMRLFNSYKKYLNPEKFTKMIDFYDYPFNPMRQQDANQFLMYLSGRIEEAGYKDQLHDVFGGNLRNHIMFDVQGRKVRKNNDEHFNSLTIDIKNMNNLEEALEYFIKPQTITDYYSEQLGKKTKAQKQTFVKQFPKILILNLKRFQYLYQSRARSKLNDYFEFPFQLDMFKYSEDFSADKEQQNETKYKLVGVLVHVGSAESGHYYSIIKVGQKWYEFNDRFVKEFPLEQLNQVCFGGFLNQNTCNAYMIFYQKIETKYHGVHIAQIDPENPIKKKVAQENSQFLNSRLIYDDNFRNFLQKAYQLTKNQIIQDVIDSLIDSQRNMLGSPQQRKRSELEDDMIVHCDRQQMQEDKNIQMKLIDDDDIKRYDDDDEIDKLLS